MCMYLYMNTRKRVRGKLMNQSNLNSCLFVSFLFFEEEKKMRYRSDVAALDVYTTSNRNIFAQLNKKKKQQKPKREKKVKEVRCTSENFQV